MGSLPPALPPPPPPFPPLIAAGRGADTQSFSLILMHGVLWLRCPVDFHGKKERRASILFGGLVDFKGEPFPKEKKRKKGHHWATGVDALRTSNIGNPHLPIFASLKSFSIPVCSLLDRAFSLLTPRKLAVTANRIPSLRVECKNNKQKGEIHLE